VIHAGATVAKNHSLNSADCEVTTADKQGPTVRWNRITVSLRRYSNPSLAAATFSCTGGQPVNGVGERACELSHEPPREGLGATISILTLRKYDLVQVDYYTFPGYGNTVDDAQQLATTQDITRQLLATL
jgi:hypothetical protein